MILCSKYHSICGPVSMVHTALNRLQDRYLYLINEIYSVWLQNLSSLIQEFSLHQSAYLFTVYSLTEDVRPYAVSSHYFEIWPGLRCRFMRTRQNCTHRHKYLHLQTPLRTHPCCGHLVLVHLTAFAIILQHKIH